MLIKRVVCLLLACVLVLSGCSKQSKPLVHKPDFEVVSTSAFLIELNSGDIIYEKAPDDRVTPYSLTQMLTALLAIEETEDLSAEVASPVTLDDGEESETSYSMEQLLRYIILGSNKQAAQLIAFTVGGGDQNSFISRLNERARGLGAKTTNFADASGEDTSNNYTTARDVAMIASAICKNDVYMSIASELSYTLPSSDTHEGDTIENENGIEDVANEDSFFSQVTGIKYSVGSDGLSNLVCITEQNGMKLLLVLLGAPTQGESTIYTDAKGLFEWALSTCKLVHAPESEKAVTEIAVASGFAQKSVSLSLSKKLASVLPKTAVPDDVYLLCRLPAEITTKTSKGDVVGIADVLHKNELLLSVNLVADKAVTEKGAAPAWVGVLLTVLGVILGLFVILFIIRQINIIRYRKKRLRMLDEKRRRMRNELEKANSGPRPPMQR